jgi:site-specific recombinase XerD
VKPIHAASFIEELLQELSKATVKQHLAVLRMLFNWLVIGHIMDVNPAHAESLPCIAGCLLALRRLPECVP